MIKPEDMPIKPGEYIPEALGWENFKMSLFGKDILQFSAFNLNLKSEIQFNTGKGGQPVSWSIKSYNRECKATVYVEELKDIITAALAWGGDPNFLPPGPVVAQAHSAVGLLLLQIPFAKIMNVPFDFKKDQTVTEVALDIAVVSVPIITFA